MQKSKNFLSTVFIIVLCFFSVRYAHSVALSVQSSISVCLETIIPSLYIFMILSAMLIQSSFLSIANKLFNPISRILLNIRGDIFAIFLISQIGGYPVGAKLLSKMYENGSITKADAEKYTYFCASCGPAFILGVIPSKEAFIPVFVSCFLSNLILCFFMCRFSKTNIKTFENRADTKIDIVECVQSAARSIFTICIMIIAARAAVSISEELGLFNSAAHILDGITIFKTAGTNEVLYSICEISNVQSVKMIPVSAALLSFGGLCVIMQICAVSSANLKFGRMCLARSLCAVISGVICSLLYKGSDLGEAVFTYAQAKKPALSSTAAESMLLLLMACMLISKNSRQNENNML